MTRMRELCDTVTPDQWFHVKSTAKQLDCLRHYSKPERYLQAVQLHGLRMTEAKV